MDIQGPLLVAGVWFARSVVGSIFRPYETFRRIVERASAWELTYVAVALAMYFAVASVVKTAAFRPFLLTRQFVVLAGATALTFVVAVWLLWTIGTWVGGKGTQKGFAVAWGYTLLPTLAWFLTTSLLYVFLPPPRTTSSAGLLFSAVYLVFSATLFFWKLMLAYLALRFGMRLDLAKILVVALVALPLLGLYSVGMYWMGIFRIPFL